MASTSSIGTTSSGAQAKKKLYQQQQQQQQHHQQQQQQHQQQQQKQQRKQQRTTITTITTTITTTIITITITTTTSPSISTSTSTSTFIPILLLLSLLSLLDNHHLLLLLDHHHLFLLFLLLLLPLLPCLSSLSSHGNHGGQEFRAPLFSFSIFFFSIDFFGPVFFGLVFFDLVFFGLVFFDLVFFGLFFFSSSSISSVPISSSITSLVFSGADIALVDMNKDEAEKQCQLLVDAFVKENPNAERIPKVTAHYPGVSDPESVDACIAEVLEKHGKIDSLVTSPGFAENFEAINYPTNCMRKLWAVNTPHGTQAPGSVFMIGSMSGAVVNVPQPQAPYNASKAAVRQLAASLAVEWAYAGIRVNCISPGYMLTALTPKIMDDNPDLHQKWVSLIPQGKMGKPEDLMGPHILVVLLKSLHYWG
uniref:Uncharacterized protein n=1 Tax=Bionectria ochroleuca TaxID=29856 RepID=A0A8H7N3H3_BIOOC